jgi:hypothetical protein
MKIFPNVRKATVSHVAQRIREGNDFVYVEGLSPLNSWFMFEELEVQDFKDGMLDQINVKTLRSLKINTDHKNDKQSWRQFCLRHPQLERLEVGRYSFKSLSIIMTNLPNLKSLIFKTVVSKISEEKAINMIAENCAKLEYLEIGVERMKAETAVTILKEKLLKLRGCVKQINVYEQTFDITEI